MHCVACYAGHWPSWHHKGAHSRQCQERKEREGWLHVSCNSSSSDAEDMLRFRVWAEIEGSSGVGYCCTVQLLPLPGANPPC